MKKLFLTLFILLIATITFWPKSRQCVVVDMDGSFDDFRAVAWLGLQKKVDFIIFTEGVTRPRYALHVIREFNRQSSSPLNEQPQMIIGLETNRKIDHKWTRLRERDERFNGLFEATPSSDGSEFYDGIKTISNKCDSIDLLISGPLTSAQHYWSVFDGHIHNAVAMGRQDKRDFNCWYDLQACKSVFALAGDKLSSIFIPEKDSDFQAYRFSSKDIARLGEDKMAGVFKKAFMANPEGWNSADILMWDDITATFLIYPEYFVKTPTAFEPNRPAELYKTLWIDSINHNKRRLKKDL
jgi:inosine-uridine nucleoside N-ribohydrolase